MQMNEIITQAINQEVKIEAAEHAVLQTLLEAAITGVQRMKLDMTEERWLRLGIHLVSVIRRANNREFLPAVDETMLEQVDFDMRDLSRQVLQAAAATLGRHGDATEVLLLAVHFAAAKHSN